MYAYVFIVFGSQEQARRPRRAETKAETRGEARVDFKFAGNKSLIRGLEFLEERGQEPRQRCGLLGS